MSTLPPPFDPSDDDADEQYRRASERDPSRPSEATRRAVLGAAARLAAERARRDARRRWLSLIGAPLRMRPAIVGTIAAAVLAGIVIAPQFLPDGQRSPVTTPPQAASAPATAPAASPIAEAPQAAPAAQLAAEERAPRPAPPESASSAARTAPRLQARQATELNEMALKQSVTAKVTPEADLQGGVGAQDRGAAAGEASQAKAARSIAPLTAASAPVRAQVPAAPPVSGGPDALRQAAAAGDVTALRAQLASGSDIDARDAQGRTALMLATLNGRSNAVAVLLTEGADPSAADGRGTTPLQAAVAADEREIIAMLRRYGAR